MLATRYIQACQTSWTQACLASLNMIVLNVAELFKLVYIYFIKLVMHNVINNNGTSLIIFQRAIFNVSHIMYA